jgi:hypothetical protein
MELGLPPHIEAAEATIPALVDAVVAAVQERIAGNTE